MDWKKTFNQGQWFVHGVFIVAILIGIGSTLFAFRLNHLQSTEEDQLASINSIIQHLKQDNGFEKIGKYLSWTQPDKANDKIRELTQSIAEIEEMLEIKASTDVGLAIRTFNKLINNNSGMSDPVDALKVLNQKINSLHEYASSQKYQNVSVLAGKMKERMSGLTPKNVGESAQVNHLASDLKRMESLVGRSTLTESEKNKLNSRFNSMKNEMELLGNLNSHSKNIASHITQSALAMGNWLLEVENKTSNIKDIRISKQNKLMLMLAGLVAFLIITWVGLAYLFRWQKEKMSFQVEAEVKTVIEKGIISDQRYMIDHYSEHTREDIVRLLDELKVKLNLGTILHEGLPFAGCMIDYNFKLTWHNNLFLDQLYLSEEEVRSDAFNWDYVRDYLNLEEDPIYQAMVNKIAGIYPVKVKQDEMTPAQPYEMYVTPISANRESRIMVFFYPLISVKEAIKEQVDLAESSIHQFITLWNDNQLDEDELRFLEKNFKNNDLNDLYRELSHVFERVNAEKSECIDAIRSLEKENKELNLTIAQMRELKEQKQAITREEIKTAGELRNSFIVSMDKCEKLLNINKEILQQSDDFKTEAHRLHQVSVEAIKKGKESMEILGQLDSVKVDYKKLKFELMEIKAKLVSLNNALFAQLPPLDENQQKLAMRYKDELARLDFTVATLDKKLSQLDVFLSKLNMINEKKTMEQTSFSFQTTQKDHALRESIIEIQKSLGQEEGKIIDHFKSLHALMKQDMNPSLPNPPSIEGENFLS